MKHFFRKILGEKSIFLIKFIFFKKNVGLFLAARKYFCPHQSFFKYVASFLKFYYLKPDVYRISRDEKDLYLNSMEMQRKSFAVPENVKINFYGRDKYLQYKNVGQPIILLCSHHGHPVYAERYVVDLFPDIHRFHGGLIPFGKNLPTVLASEMQDALKGMVKMAELIKEKKTVLIYFDGSRGGRGAEVMFLGMRLYFPAGIFNLARSLGAVLLPMTSYLSDANEANIFIGDSLFGAGELNLIDNQQAVTRSFNYFMADLKKHNPWAVDLPALWELAQHK